MILKGLIQQTGQRDKFCDKCLRHENTGNFYKFQLYNEG